MAERNSLKATTNTTLDATCPCGAEFSGRADDRPGLGILRMQYVEFKEEHKGHRKPNEAKMLAEVEQLKLKISQLEKQAFPLKEIPAELMEKYIAEMYRVSPANVPLTVTASGTGTAGWVGTTMTTGLPIQWEVFDDPSTRQTHVRGTLTDSDGKRRAAQGTMTDEWMQAINAKKSAGEARQEALQSIAKKVERMLLHGKEK